MGILDTVFYYVGAVVTIMTVGSAMALGIALMLGIPEEREYPREERDKDYWNTP